MKKSNETVTGILGAWLAYHYASDGADCIPDVHMLLIFP